MAPPLLWRNHGAGKEKSALDEILKLMFLSTLCAVTGRKIETTHGKENRMNLPMNPGPV
jgi:hypothetical protein